MGEQQVDHENLTDDADTTASEGIMQDVLALAGSWSDLSWDEVEKELERIRHESQPSSPLIL